jgi:pyrroloquinoline quinone (PQQ) biosynthesis protein C
MQTQAQRQLRTQTDWTQTLEHEARTLVEELDMLPGAQRLFDGSIDTRGYVDWLVQTYHYVRWTTPLLRQAGQRLKQLGCHLALAELLLQKAEEERGHERWLLADLKHLGCTRPRVEQTAPCPAVRAYVEWNRFTAEAGSPTAFLGTAYVLEYLSVYRASAAVEHLLAHGAIPDIHRAVTFLRGHAGADTSHLAQLSTVLRGLSEPREQAAIVLSARATRTLYRGLFLLRP